MTIPDWKIRELSCITPLIENQQQQKGKLGTGLSSFGYDLSLNEEEFFFFKGEEVLDSYTGIIDPKNFNPSYLKKAYRSIDEETNDKYFILPPFSTGLGVVNEYIEMPSTYIGQVVGKSTYARCGIICPITPIESGWKGYLTVELFNSTALSVKIYAGEGVCQVLFQESSYGECEIDYTKREGKYNYQSKKVTLPRVNKK